MPYLQHCNEVQSACLTYHDIASCNQKFVIKLTNKLIWVAM